MKRFLQVWFLSIIRPGEAYDRLLEAPAPHWGLYATLVRFMRNAFEGSWLPRPAKDAYLASLLDYAAAHGIVVS